MRGLYECIARHISEDALRAQMLGLLNELSDGLGGVNQQEEASHSVWSVNIGPWGNCQGFDISLRVVMGKNKRQEVTDFITKKLGCPFEKHGDRYRAEWKPNAHIYIG